MGPQSFIDSRIDVFAQWALIRMSRHPSTSGDATAMLAAVKSGQLAGIYKEDQQIPAQRATRLGHAWWKLIPQGRDAVPVRDPNAQAAPILVFRNTIRSIANRLDPALVDAFRESGIVPVAPPPSPFLPTRQPSRWTSPFQPVNFPVEATTPCNFGTRSLYHSRALQTAFGSSSALPAWDPALGYKANRPRILKLYDYYRDTYLKSPGFLLWAGLGRMAGGAVIEGLDTMVLVPFTDKDIIAQKMVEIGKAIFDDLAWQHEAFIDMLHSPPECEDAFFALLRARDTENPKPVKSYEQAWRKIYEGVNGSPARIAEGNRDLLENEQWVIIQPRYDSINAVRRALFGRTSAFARNVHPYHRDFMESMPAGRDVTVAADRWTWIIQRPHGMWAKWAERHKGQWGAIDEMPIRERIRLVSLDMRDIIQQRWGAVIQDMLPPGAP